MKSVKYTAYKSAIISLILASASANHAFAAENNSDVANLTAQLNALKAEISQLQEQTEALATQQEKASTTTGSKATLWGYGEVKYTNFTNSPQQSVMDLARAVFGIGYQFNDRTRFFSEYEIEHAVSSADDAGEVEVEQFYIDHQLTANTHLKAGLFLIPAGLLNENHEPNRFYGVERNLVETAIIPSTWREGGVAIYGTNDIGLAWDVGITTTVDIGGWDALSTEGRESPLGSIHQELQLANADDLGFYGALNYRGIPGLVIGGSAFTSQVSQNSATLQEADDIRLSLWDAHIRWTADKWDLSALYAEGHFSNTRGLNVTLAGGPTPVPEKFFGWYTQVAYQAWAQNNYAITPFIRYERVNTAANFASMPAGLGVASADTEAVTTYGASFFLSPDVVIKADYQHYANDDAQSRVNLGLGLAF